MIYPEMRGDYYSRAWTANEYQEQLEILLDSHAYIAATPDGFVRLNLLEKIGELFKRILGGTDRTQECRVQAAWLKFLYYGEAQGFLGNDQIHRLQDRIRAAKDLDPAVRRLFREIHNQHISRNKKSTPDHFQHLREMLVDYHQRHASSLRPGLWSRYMNSPFLDERGLNLFGDTFLKLSEMALKQETRNPLLAFSYLQRASALKNGSLDFQKALSQQLQSLQDTYQADLLNKKNHVQELWIQLAQTAFENDQKALANNYLETALLADPANAAGCLQIGKLYLAHKEYDRVQPFLPDLQKAFIHDPLLQIEISQAFIQKEKFKEAIVAYETAIKCYQSMEASFSNQTRMASLHHEIGKIYLDHLMVEDPNNLIKTIQSFSAAVKIHPQQGEYQKSLCQAYIQQWKASPEKYAGAYGQTGLPFIAGLQSNLIHTHGNDIKQILIGCAERFFQAHANQHAHACLETLLHLFPEQVELKLQALEMAVRYHDWMRLEPRLESWRSKHYANPYLKKKIGDAYWQQDKNLALTLYQEALDLFSKRLPLCQEGEERLDCQHQMADIQARIGQNYLNSVSGFVFKYVPFKKAIESLEQAANLNPKLYASALFEACLAGAKEEKEKLLTDKDKIIVYYQKAFNAAPQNGPYLIELMQLYLDSKNFDGAMALYKEIQKQPWTKEFILPAAYHKLGHKFIESSEMEKAHACFKQAHSQEPKNKTYKEDYFQLSLALSQEHYKQLKTKGEEAHDQLLSLAQMLTACYETDFQLVDKLKSPFQEMLAKVYGTLAACYVQRCLFPLSASEHSHLIGRDDIRKQTQLHREDIQQALQYYDQALHYQSTNAALHFEKGLLFDWMVEYENALAALQLAVKHEPNNPFYHKFIVPLYYAVKPGSGKNEEHSTLAKECASPQFETDFKIWKKEWMFRTRTKQIDPHAYTKPKTGWFS